MEDLAGRIILNLEVSICLVIIVSKCSTNSGILPQYTGGEAVSGAFSFWPKNWANWAPRPSGTAAYMAEYLEILNIL